MTAKTKTLWTFAITSIALFMVTLDNLVVTTAIPVIRDDLDASLESLEWTVNAYTLTFAVLLLTGAALGDRFGRRRVFAIGVGVFTLGSVAAALAPTVELLNLARAVQGLGGAIVMPLTLTILSAAVPREKRGLALGAWGGISGLAVAFGPVVGGAVVQGLSWQWIFWLNVPIGLLLIPLALTRLQETLRAGRQARPARARARERRAVRDRLGPHPRQRPGLDEPRDRRLARARRAPRGGVRRLGAADGGADAADALLPQAVVRARERRLALHVLRDVRLDLPARAVLPDGAGLLAARRRPADPAVDARADVHRADRRRDVRPHPGEDARRRPASTLQAVGARLARARLDADGGLLDADRSRSCSPASGCRSSSPRWRTSSSRPCARRRRARPRAPTTRSASSAASSASPCWPPSSRASAATRAARPSWTG